MDFLPPPDYYAFHQSQIAEEREFKHREHPDMPERLFDWRQPGVVGNLAAVEAADRFRDEGIVG